MLQLAGNNKFYQINDDLSKKNSKNEPIIYPSYRSSLNISSLQSFSTCYDHSVFITKDGIIKAVGNNINRQIWDSLPKEVLKKWTQFDIQDIYGYSYIPLSVACGYDYTLYMAQKNDDKSVHLFYIRSNKNCGLPLLLNTKGKQPKAIYSGLTLAAAIDSEGSIHIINDQVFTTLDNIPRTGSLPNGEIAISVACCEKKFYALSSNGNVYHSQINTYDIIFTEVTELKNYKIISISGLSNQCLAVSSGGSVFGFGNTDVLGINSKEKTVDQFTRIQGFSSLKIIAAYAGTTHSLFQAINGKILSCGYKDTGALLVDGDLNDECVSSPIETIIKLNAKFCIAGVGVSAVFVNCEIPKNCPNQLTQRVEGSDLPDPIDNQDQSKCCILI